MNKEAEHDFSKLSAEERVCTIVDSYFYLSEAKLNRGEQVPGPLKEQFSEWLHDPRIGRAKDVAMMQALMEKGAQSCSAEDCRKETCYPIEEVSGMLNVPPWTILMWVNRIGMLKPVRDGEGRLMFTPQDVARIAKIRRMTRIKGISLHDIMKLLVYDYRNPRIML